MLRAKVVRSLLIGAVVAAVLAGGAAVTTVNAAADETPSTTLPISYSTDNLSIEGTATWSGDNQQVTLDLTGTPGDVPRIYLMFAAWGPPSNPAYSDYFGIHQEKALDLIEPGQDIVVTLSGINPNLWGPEIDNVRIAGYPAEDPETVHWNRVDWTRPLVFLDCVRTKPACIDDPFGVVVD
jgi:hypothetical protein